MTSNYDMEGHFRYLTQYLEDYVSRTPVVRAYWNRLKTRIVVTNSLEAHLHPNAPKDVAVYYYVPGAPENQLSLWRHAILEAWVQAIVEGYDNLSLAGMRRGVLKVLPTALTMERLTEVQRDHVRQQGYNSIRWIPGHGPTLWDDLIWRNGKVVWPNSTELGIENIYKQTATPLGLTE